EITWSTALLRLNDNVTVTQERYDWPSWLAHSATTGRPAAHETPISYVLYLPGDDIAERKVSTFAAMVLSCLETPKSAHDVRRHLDASRSLSFEPVSAIDDMIAEQLQRAYVGGLVHLVIRSGK